jgi:hypothetical protein
MAISESHAADTLPKTRRPRGQRPFPASSFEEALELPNAIQKYSSGQPIRRLTVFDQLGKSPDSGPSRQLVTNAGKYGLTKGSYAAEQIELTPEGSKATDPDLAERERARARIKLAIENIPPFKRLYEKFCGNKLPSKSVLVVPSRNLTFRRALRKRLSIPSSSTCNLWGYFKRFLVRRGSFP